MHVPPGGFGYRQPETGQTLDGQSLTGTVDLVFRHRLANSLPRATQEEVDEDVQHQICVRCGREWCSNTKLSFLGEGVSFEKLKAGTFSLATWAITSIRGQDPYVSEEEANRRAEICSRCWANKAISGCYGCGLGDRIREVLVEAKGDRRTQYDDQLQACLVCGCSNQAQVWIKPEILAAGMTDQQREVYREAQVGCWKAECKQSLRTS